MAGRKPIDDDRKRKAVTMNVSNKDLKILDNFIRFNNFTFNFFRQRKKRKIDIHD